MVWFWFGLVGARFCLKEVLLAGAQVPEHNAQVSQVQREGVVVGLHNLHGAVYIVLTTEEVLDTQIGLYF